MLICFVLYSFNVQASKENMSENTSPRQHVDSSSKINELQEMCAVLKNEKEQLERHLDVSHYLYICICVLCVYMHMCLCVHMYSMCAVTIIMCITVGPTATLQCSGNGVQQ